jgi:hypothetical protein
MNSKIQEQQKNKREAGIALIAVLCTILVVSLLVASAVAISQYTAFESSTFSGISRSFYIAEGAASRVRWLLMSDRRKYPNRKLDSLDTELDENERFLANSVIHNLDYYGDKVSFQIEDASSGIDISRGAPDINLRNLFKDEDDMGEDPEFSKFCSKVHDYADSDDLISINGLEKKGYLEEYELHNLPRNNKLQFTQEIMYVPGLGNYFSPDEYGRMTSFQLIPPEKSTNKYGRPSLFSSPVSLIKNKCKLSDDETEEVKQALEKWRNESIPLEESLIPGLKARLLTYFSTVESGSYTLVIKTASKNSPGTTLVCSFYYNPGAKSTFEYHQFTFY